MTNLIGGLIMLFVLFIAGVILVVDAFRSKRKPEKIFPQLAIGVVLIVLTSFITISGFIEQSKRSGVLIKGHTYIETAKPIDDPFQVLKTDTLYVMDIKNGYVKSHYYQFSTPERYVSCREEVMLYGYTYTDITNQIKERK